MTHALCCCVVQRKQFYLENVFHMKDCSLYFFLCQAALLSLWLAHNGAMLTLLLGLLGLGVYPVSLHSPTSPGMLLAYI